MSSAPDSPGHHGPWAMPAEFLPVPRDFSCSGSNTRVDLSTKTIAQLRALAAKHNSRHGITEDPFKTTLQGIHERAKLRPDSAVATTNTLGTLLPADSPYAKAWRSIRRQVKPSKGDAATKRAEAAAAATRLAKLQSKASDPASKAQRQSQQLVVPPEQLRWRSKLSAFLARPVDVPQLTPGAPVLDMNKLFIEVMNRGGSAAVTAADGWSELAFDFQRDSEVADKVHAVYQCYLHPLELDLPFDFRPARNIDHLDSRTQQRAAMGCRVASYEAVTYTADKAAAALQQAMPWAVEPAAPATLQQHQQNSGRGPSQLVSTAMQLLYSAAVDPDAAAGQLIQQGLLVGLHKPSQEACMAAIKRAHTGRKTSRAGTELDDAQLAVADIKEDIAIVGAAGQKAVQAGTAAAQLTNAPGSAPGAAASTAVVGGLQELQEQLAVAAGSSVDGPASKKARVDPGAAASVGEQQGTGDVEQPKASSSTPTEQQQLNAARWVLLSKRAVLSGPPGCDKPPLYWPGMPVAPKPESNTRPSSGSGGASTGKTGGSITGKRVFQGFTPKCGKCKTCMNPSLKKPCVVNKERLAQGLPPILPA